MEEGFEGETLVEATDDSEVAYRDRLGGRGVGSIRVDAHRFGVEVRRRRGGDVDCEGSSEGEGEEEVDSGWFRVLLRREKVKGCQEGILGRDVRRAKARRDGRREDRGKKLTSLSFLSQKKSSISRIDLKVASS